MTKARFSLTTLCASFAFFAIKTASSDAQSIVQTYRYCSLDHTGATVCYFNDRAACDKSSSGRCIDNPYYSSAYASAPRRPGRRHRP